MRVEKPPSAEKKQETQKLPPQPLGKIIIFGIVAIGSIFLFWYSIARIFSGEVELSFSSNSIVSVLLAVFTFVLMFSLIGIAASVIRSLFIFVAVNGVGILTYFIFFPADAPNIAACLFLLTGFTLWRMSVMSDANNRIQFTVMKVVNAGLGGAITFALLSVSFTYYSYLAGADGSDRLIEGIVSTTAQSANTFLPRYVNGYSPDMTLDEFIRQSTTLDVSTIDVPPTSVIGGAIKEGLNAAQGAIVEQSREQFLTTFNIQAEGTDRMGEVVKKIVARRIETLINPYKKFIPAVLALSLYFVLGIFRFLYVPLIQILSFIVFRIFLLVKIMRIDTVMVERERVVLS